MHMNINASWVLKNPDGSIKEEIEKMSGFGFYFCREPDFDSMSEIELSEKIVYLDCCEPDFMCASTESVISNKDRYHLILTRRQQILDNTDNSLFMPFGTAWVQDFEKSKTDSISFTTTYKNAALQDGSIPDGYYLRHQIVNNIQTLKELSKIPLKYYASSRMPLNPSVSDGFIYESKTPLFAHKYHIAVENQRCDGYFSEKLIDCFRSKTIPIYFGCPSIGEFFDTEGIIIINGMDDLVDTIRYLDGSFYDSKIEIVEKNYEKSLEYCGDFVKRFVDKVENYERG